MSSVNISDEKVLILQVARGDQAAFTLLFDAYKDRIYSIVLRLTASSILAEEIVQDIFLKIWLRREALENVDHFRAYLFTATRNEVFNAFKKLARHREVTGEWSRNWPDQANTTDTLLFDKEYQRVLREAIEQLPMQQKRVYQLMKEQGLKREEVAELMQIAPNTVKQHLAQAMRSIRAFCVARLDLYIALVIFDSFRK